MSPRQRHRRRERRDREKENRTLGSDGAIVVLTGRYARAAARSSRGDPRACWEAYLFMRAVCRRAIMARRAEQQKPAER